MLNYKLIQDFKRSITCPSSVIIGLPETCNITAMWESPVSSITTTLNAHDFISGYSITLIYYLGSKLLYNIIFQ